MSECQIKQEILEASEPSDFFDNSEAVPETMTTSINALELVTIKTEPITEPELASIKEEPSQWGDEASQSMDPVAPANTETSIKNERDLITFDKPELDYIKEEPSQCDDEASQIEGPGKSYLIEIKSIPVSVHDGNELLTVSNISPSFQCYSSQYSDSSESSMNYKSLDTLAGENYICEICHKQFAQAFRLNRHQQYHKAKERYRCGVCEKSFDVLSRLERHVKTHEKPYTCDVCQKQFSVASSLKRHKQIHGVKPYSCEICMKQFTSEARLNYRQHLRSHRGQELYSCYACGKKYLLKSMLNQHTRIHMDGAT